MAVFYWFKSFSITSSCVNLINLIGWYHYVRISRLYKTWVRKKCHLQNEYRHNEQFVKWKKCAFSNNSNFIVRVLLKFWKIEEHKDTDAKCEWRQDEGAKFASSAAADPSGEEKEESKKWIAEWEKRGSSDGTNLKT